MPHYRWELVVEHLGHGLVHALRVHVPARALHEQALDVHALGGTLLQDERLLHLHSSTLYLSEQTSGAIYYR